MFHHQKKFIRAFLVVWLFLVLTTALAGQALSPSSVSAATGDAAGEFDYVAYSSEGSDGPQDSIAIVECDSGVSNCNISTSGASIVAYPASQNGNQVIYTGQVGREAGTIATLTIPNICTPGTATFQETGNKAQSITISGYTDALNKVDSYSPGIQNNGGGGSGGSGYPVCDNSGGGTGTTTGGGNGGAPEPQKVCIIANVDSAGAYTEDESVGPLTFTIDPTSTTGSTPDASVTLPATPVETAGNTTLQACSQSALNPANYTVATTQLDTPSQPIATSDFAGPISLTFSANSNATTPVSQTGSGSGSNPDAKCDPGGAFTLDWLLCPIVEKIQSAVAAITSYIESQLTVSVNDYFDDGCINSATAKCNATNVDYSLWADFRDIALTILVIAGLIMVFSQAMDFGPFDAYTVRKMLPKILMAVILISFSWEIGRFLVQFSDDLGVGVRQLILGVSPGALSNGSIATELLLGTGGALIGGAVFSIAMGPLGMVLILISVILSLAVAFLILALRKLLIIICVVSAPLAFVAYIMPGGQKIWGYWKNSFTGALLMFPMIIGVISLGQLFAYLEYQTGTKGGGGGFVPGLIAIILYFGPFFLLPKIARSSMGAMGSIIGLVHSVTHGANGRGGAFGALKKGRKDAGAKERARILSGDKKGWRGNVGVGLSTGWKGRYGVGKKGAAATAIKRGDNVANTLKNVPGLAQLGKTDDWGNALMALSGGDGSNANLKKVAEELTENRTFDKNDKVRDQQMREAEQDRMVRAAQAVGVNKATAQAALTTMAQNKSRAIGGGQFQMVEKGIQRLTGGDKNAEKSVAQTFQYYSRDAGRADLGGDWTSDSVASMSNPVARRDAVMMEGLSKTDLPSLAKSYPKALKQANQTLARKMASPDLAERREAGIRALEMGAALPYATGGAADEINAGSAKFGITPGSPVPPAKQVADRINTVAQRTNPGAALVDPNDLNSSARSR
jgi:hypothetical protein